MSFSCSLGSTIPELELELLVLGGIGQKFTPGLVAYLGSGTVLESVDLCGKDLFISLL
jgi:hypothetical protein